MELFVAQQLYSVLEELVRATHEESADKIQVLTRDLADRLSDYCLQMKANLKTQTETAIDKVVASGEKAQINTTEVVQEIRTKADAQIQQLLRSFEKAVAKIAAEIETKVGPQGLPGRPGVDGKDGSPDTPEEVVSKVNKAGGVKISAVDGLDERLKQAKKEGGGGKSGGGMGNPQHETKSVSSGTTSVTTTYTIAAGGRALWIYYQGQFLVYGTHYTVSGKIISLIATPLVDGTFLDITYIRG